MKIMRHFLIALALLIGGCATVTLKPSSPQFRMAGIVAGVEIRVYSTRHDLLAGIPMHVVAFSASIEKIDPNRGVGAFYDWNREVIHIQEGDTMALVHEFKHYVDVPWVHGFTSSPEDQGWRQSGLDKIFILRDKEFAIRDSETIEAVVMRLKEFFN